MSRRLVPAGSAPPIASQTPRACGDCIYAADRMAISAGGGRAAFGVLPGVAAGGDAVGAHDVDPRGASTAATSRPTSGPRDVAEVDVAGRRLRAADEGRLYRQPRLLGHRPERADRPSVIAAVSRSYAPSSESGDRGASPKTASVSSKV